jgi:hypothetical protein
MILRGGLILILLSSITSNAFHINKIRSVKTLIRSPTAITSSAEAAEKSSSVPDFSSSTKPIDEAAIFADDGDSTAEASSWQENLELLLAPDTPVAERQIVLSDLLNSGDKIQDSVRTALRERKVSSSIYVCCKSLYSPS